jgi:thioredoxin reductase (NADPH)
VTRAGTPTGRARGAVAGEATAETPDQEGAFPRLSETQLARLESEGTRRRTVRGETLVTHGR